MKSVSQFKNDVDREILALFPSLDFNRRNIQKNRISRMEKYLQVLKKAANEEKVTEYSLTKPGVQSRMGNETAIVVLKELEDLGLLKVEQAISEKKRPRRDHILTPKGIIACLALLEFQQSHKLNQLLEKACNQQNNLVSTLKIYNEFVRRQYDAKSKVSPAIIIIKELATQGLNLERISEDVIAHNLRTTEENGFIASLKVSPFDHVSVLMLMTQDEKKRDFLQRFIDVFSKKNYDPEDMQLIISETKKMSQSLISFITSPEVRSSLTMKKEKLTRLQEEAEKLLSQIDFDDEHFSEVFEIYFKTLKEKIIANTQ